MVPLRRFDAVRLSSSLDRKLARSSSFPAPGSDGLAS